VFGFGIRSTGTAGAAVKTALAGVIAAAAVTLTACGPAQMGAAAIIGTDRVPTSTLSGDVSALNKVYQAYPSLQANVQYKPSQMPQLVLMWLIRFKILDDIAQRAGVQVSPGEAQATLDGAIRQIEQQTTRTMSQQEFAMFNAVPPNLAGQFGRFEATLEKLAVLYTGATSASSLSPSQQEEFSRRLSAEVAAATKRLNIKINPRFGQLDERQLTIVATPDRLSRPEPSA
jgi:hypothetical protein